MKFSLLYVTHENIDAARKIIDVLLAEKMIACANIFPIQSVYRWKWEIADTTEVVTLLKTSNKLTQVVEQKILEMHPYEIPCVMVLSDEIVANLSYASWIQDETNS